MKFNKCSNCDGRFKFIGNYSIRTGGSGGGLGFLTQGLSQMSEQPWPMDFYQCEQCGKIQMYDKKQYPEKEKKD